MLKRSWNSGYSNAVFMILIGNILLFSLLVVYELKFLTFHPRKIFRSFYVDVFEHPMLENLRLSDV